MEFEKKHVVGAVAGVLILVGLVLIVMNLRGPKREKLAEVDVPKADVPTTSGGRLAPGASAQD